MATINIPQIRFKGFEGEWEKKIFEDICTFGNGYTPSKAIDEYWENGTLPWYRMEDIRENGRILKDSIQHITPKAVKGKLFPANSIIMSTTATIGEHALLIADSLANQRFTFFIKNVNRYNYDDLFFFYKCYSIGEWCKKNANAGGLLAVNMPELKKLGLSFPTSISEQTRIASLFTAIDKQISTSEAKLDKLRTIKKTLLKKMFAAQGELTPQIRFKGFDGEWEKKTFSDVFSLYSNYSFSRSQLNENNGEIKSIHYGDILIKYGAILDAMKEDIPYLNSDINVPLLSQNFVKDGDIIIADAAEDSAVGKCIEIKNIGKRITLSGLHTIPCRPKIQFGKGFLGHYMNSSAYHSTLIQIMQGTKVSSISKKAISKTYLNYTPNISEQTRIASLFTALDKQISTSEAKLEKLRTIKKTLLKKMFV